MKFLHNISIGFCGFSLASLLLHIGFSYGAYVPGLGWGLWLAWAVCLILAIVFCIFSALAIVASAKTEGFKPNEKGMQAIVLPWIVLIILALGGLASVWIR